MRRSGRTFRMMMKICLELSKGNNVILVTPTTAYARDILARYRDILDTAQVSGASLRYICMTNYDQKLRGLSRSHKIFVDNAIYESGTPIDQLVCLEQALGMVGYKSKPTVKWNVDLERRIYYLNTDQTHSCLLVEIEAVEHGHAMKVNKTWIATFSDLGVAKQFAERKFVQE